MRQNGISEYRAELMAISMFAILLTHLKASFGVYALDRVALLCQGGVDVFLFLSGFGLYYSGMKSDNPLRFYSKRFKRIFPSFWVVMLLTFWLIDKLHWPNVLWGGSTLAFWFQSTNKYSFGWFVSLIVVLYAVFPWFFRLFRKHPKIATLFGVGVGLLLTGMYVYRYQVVYPGGQNRFILPAARVAIFFLGVYGAHWLVTEKETSETVKRKEKWLLVSVALVGLLFLNLALNAWGFRTMRNTGLLYWSYVLIIPGFLIACVWMFQKMRATSIGNQILNVLKHLGGCTLEAYLLIAVTYSYVPLVARQLGVSPLASNLLLLVATVVAAWITHRVVDGIMRKAKLL